MKSDKCVVSITSARVGGLEGWGGVIHNSEIRHAVFMGGMHAMLLALIQLGRKGHVMDGARLQMKDVEHTGRIKVTLIDVVFIVITVLYHACLHILLYIMN